MKQPTGSDEGKQIDDALKSFKKGMEGLTHVVQGIDAAGEKLDLVFIGFPDEKSVKQLGPLAKAMFSKRFPRQYGTVLAVVLTENKKLAEYLHTKIGKRYSFARLAQAEEMIGRGDHDEAAAFLVKLTPTLPRVAEVFLRVGDLYLFYLRPPRAEPALNAFRKALELHGSDPLDPVYLATAHFGEGRALAALGKSAKSLAALDAGAKAAEVEAPRLAARILMEKARVQAGLDDADGVYESLEAAFELEARLGFNSAALDCREDPVLSDLAKKSKLSSLISKYARVKPKVALLPSKVESLDVTKSPLIVLPVTIDKNWNPAAGLEAELEKGIKARFRGAAGFGVDYKDWRAPAIRWTSRELGELAWKGIEELGCFDLRWTGPAAARGRGAELAEYAATEGKAKGIAPLNPVRVLVFTLALDKRDKRVAFDVKAFLVEASGRVLAATRFERVCSASQKHQRAEMSRIGAEVHKRFAKALK